MKTRVAPKTKRLKNFLQKIEKKSEAGGNSNKLVFLCFHPTNLAILFCCFLYFSFKGKSSTEKPYSIRATDSGSEPYQLATIAISWIPGRREAPTEAKTEVNFFMPQAQ